MGEILFSISFPFAFITSFVSFLFLIFLLFCFINCQKQKREERKEKVGKGKRKRKGETERVFVLVLFYFTSRVNRNISSIWPGPPSTVKVDINREAQLRHISTLFFILRIIAIISMLAHFDLSLLSKFIVHPSFF